MLNLTGFLSLPTMNRPTANYVHIYVNNRLVARGEVVVVEERLGVTMTEIIKTERN